MDIQDEDIIAFWRAMQKFDVRYIMIGGFATNMHGFNRTTADIDIWLQDSSENRNKLGDALMELGIDIKEMIQRIEFIPGWTMIKLKGGFPLDILTTVKGLENMTFDECYELSVKASIENATVRFLHINHLILAKKATGRPKDLIDIEELEKLRKEI